MLKFTVLVENETSSPLLKNEHALSLYIEANGLRILLDAGGSSCFMENAKTLGIVLKGLDYLFLSHGHYDHGNGFVKLLKENEAYKVISSENIFKQYYSNSNTKLHYIGLTPKLIDFRDRFITITSITKDIEAVDSGIDVKQKACDKQLATNNGCTENKGYIEITQEIIFVPNPKDTKGKDIGKKNGLFVLKNEDAFKSNSSADVNIKQLTYDMLDYDDFSHEGSLVIKDDNSLIVYNSCSHYGVINIINHIKSLDIFKEYPIKAYVGGLHLKGMDVETNEYIHSECEIKELAKYFIENKIKVYTGHCTGDRAYEILGSLMATGNLYRLKSGIEFNI